MPVTSSSSVDSLLSSSTTPSLFHSRQLKPACFTNILPTVDSLPPLGPTPQISPGPYFELYRLLWPPCLADADIILPLLYFFFIYYYLRQGGYVFVVVCLSVCLLATLRKNLQTDMHELLREDWQWAVEQMVKFWWHPDHPLNIQGLFSGFVTIGRYGKWYQPTALRDAEVQGMCTSRHRHGNYDTSTSPAHDRHPQPTCLGGGMHCHSA